MNTQNLERLRQLRDMGVPEKSPFYLLAEWLLQWSEAMVTLPEKLESILNRAGGLLRDLMDFIKVEFQHLRDDLRSTQSTLAETRKSSETAIRAMGKIPSRIEVQIDQNDLRQKVIEEIRRIIDGLVASGEMERAILKAYREQAEKNNAVLAHQLKTLAILESNHERFLKLAEKVKEKYLTLTVMVMLLFIGTAFGLMLSYVRYHY